MKNKIAIGCGLIIALGLPFIAWIYFDWKAAVTVFIVGQGLLLFVQSIPDDLSSKGNNEHS